jgi:Pyridoxamine 5'-phosphate oxidase
MGRCYDQIDDRLASWLVDQPIFFVATAPLDRDGHINCSPKGNRGEFAVIDGQTVAYLDLTGSGIETVAHVQENGRIVLMFCAFQGPPRIVRLHGNGQVVTADEERFAELAGCFSGAVGVGVRTIVVVDVRRIADSCGYGVPLMNFAAHRPLMDEWSERKGADGLRSYRSEKNVTSIDGLPGLSTSLADGQGAYVGAGERAEAT